MLPQQREENWYQKSKLEETERKREVLLLDLSGMKGVERAVL